VTAWDLIGDRTAEPGLRHTQQLTIEPALGWAMNFAAQPSKNVM
jgi:hypothetical protein